MKEKSSANLTDTVEHLKFEVAQEYGLNRKNDKKSKKNIKNS
ncbi:MAG: hypothetical protein ACOX6F_01885 [Syntrophomonadaceae bacterium]|mgnify:CR=1 FL=1|jgi:hypothetical protein|nr:hypothetical protein [Bacillota bacterium]HOB12204.1 hypothetical protein [Syntrophomonadaceae bacterium]HQA07553.1 hypothetical protein [Syntrophomonadaceae bacterium]HQE23255.1 hypothetical protein [Syntrophomonadaceae bacterium]